MNRVIVIFIIICLVAITNVGFGELINENYAIAEECEMKEKIIKIMNQLKTVPNNQAVLDELDWLTFYIALTPIPAVQQASQVANKIIADHKLKLQFDEIRGEILKLNTRIDKEGKGMEMVDAIAKTVYSSEKLEKKVEEFVKHVIDELEADNAEFIVDTSNWSTQILVKQIIDANIVQIKAENHSQNVIRDTKIKAKQTRLEAHDHSVNYIDGTSFQGDSGRIDMHGIGQTGHVRVEGSSISLYGNSGITFGVRPKTVSGNCPFCGNFFEFREFEIQEGMIMECPICQKRLTVTFKKL